jgi:hypothetical protein
MPMASPLVLLRRLVCPHYWRGIEDRRPADNTDMIINFRDVECVKCGKKTRLTREAYVKHMVQTKRI